MFIPQTQQPSPRWVGNKSTKMSYDTTVFLAVLLLAFCVYFPIMKIARQDMNARSQAGLSNTPILMLLMLPILGPLLFLLLRSSFKVK